MGAQGTSNEHLSQYHGGAKGGDAKKQERKRAQRRTESVRARRSGGEDSGWCNTGRSFALSAAGIRRGGNSKASSASGGLGVWAGSVCAGRSLRCAHVAQVASVHGGSLDDNCHQHRRKHRDV